MKKSAILGLLFSMLTTAACSKNSSNNQEVVCQDGVMRTKGVIGGEVVSKESWLAQGLVAVFQITSDDKMFICTGSLIDNNVVLTAAHCVDQRADTKHVFVAFSIDPMCNVFHEERYEMVRQADFVIEHSSYTGTDDGHDIALIRFDRRAPDETHSMPLVMNPVQLPQSIYVSGFGNEIEYDHPKSKTRLKIAEVRPFHKTNKEKRAEAETSTSNLDMRITLDQRYGQGACNGDSGGPALLQNNSKFYVLGVASRGVGLERPFEVQEDVTCKQGVQYTSVYFYRDWIQENYNSLKNENSRGYLLTE